MFIKRLHGATHHAVDVIVTEERIPETLSGLYEQLEAAVQREAYEEAGEIRDRIEKLKAHEDHDV